jgi:type I restriction enzyme M protein
MALKKSELYSSLWSCCDELYGGIDASQHKDYVLVLQFIKYIMTNICRGFLCSYHHPEGSSFAAIITLKGKPDIGDQINKKIVVPLVNANKLSDIPVLKITTIPTILNHIFVLFFVEYFEHIQLPLLLRCYILGY